MSAEVRVHLLPSLFEPAELSGGTAVIIDVLRASTTMIQALHSDAARILPCGSVEEATLLGAGIPKAQVLFGGERHGKLIEGFDLDNSPRLYTSERVGGKTVIFTTTNGTRALLRAEQAASICIGAFVNLSAVEGYLRGQGGPIHLVCAGTDGRLTAEDILFAGVLADRLVGDDSSDGCDVSTEMAIDFARRNAGSAEEILKTLRRSQGGKNLTALGMDADIVFAADSDRLPVVPVWDAGRRSTREVRLV
ncbi:MAG: 2-phosphosulfolactate phosphatase [Planctomycetaceae bacterium]|nr:2-phosphosulfolactate phosphatase [Planctomycetaceae bacterium]